MLSRDIAEVLHRLDQEFDVSPQKFKSLHIIAKDADAVATKAKLTQQKYDCDEMISAFVKLNHQTFTSSLANVRRAAARFTSARERMSKLPTRVKECRVLHETLHASSELEAASAQAAQLANISGGSAGSDASHHADDRDRLSGLVQEERKMRHVVDILTSLERANGVTQRLEQFERQGELRTAAVLVEDAIEMLESTGIESLLSVKSIVDQLRHQRDGIAAKLAEKLFRFLYEGVPVGRASPQTVAALARERKAGLGASGGGSGSASGGSSGGGGSSSSSSTAKAGAGGYSRGTRPPAPGRKGAKKGFSLLRDGGGSSKSTTRAGLHAAPPGGLATDRAIAATMEHILLPLQHMSVGDEHVSVTSARRPSRGGGAGGASERDGSGSGGRETKATRNHLDRALVDLSARFESGLQLAINAAVADALSETRRAERVAWRKQEEVRLRKVGRPALIALLPPPHVANAHAAMSDVLHVLSGVHSRHSIVIEALRVVVPDKMGGSSDAAAPRYEPWRSGGIAKSLRAQPYSTVLVHTGIIRGVCNMSLELLGADAKRAVGVKVSRAPDSLASPSLNGLNFGPSKSQRTTTGRMSHTSAMAQSQPSTRRRRRRMSSMVGMEIPFAFTPVSVKAESVEMQSSVFAAAASASASAATSTLSSAALLASPSPTLSTVQRRPKRAADKHVSEGVLSESARMLCAMHCSPSYASLLPLMPLVQRFADDRLGTQDLQSFFASLILGKSSSLYLQVTADGMRRRAARCCCAAGASTLGGSVSGDAASSSETSRSVELQRRSLPEQLESMTLEGTRSIATIAAALHVMDRDLAPQVVETLGLALSDSMEEAPKAAWTFLESVENRYDHLATGGGNALSVGGAASASSRGLPPGAASAQAEESVEFPIDSTEEMRVLVGLMLHTVPEINDVALGMDTSGDVPASHEQARLVNYERSAAARTKLLRAHDRFEQIACSAPPRSGPKASWLLSPNDLALVARLHRSMRGVAKWCRKLEGKLKSMVGSSSSSGGGAAATLRTIAAEEKSAGLCSWMVPPSGAFHFSSRSSELLASGGGRSSMYKEGDDLMPLWLKVKSSSNGGRSSVAAQQQRGGSGGGDDDDSGAVSLESIRELREDPALSVEKVAQLPKRTLQGNEVRTSLSRTCEALVAVAIECDEVAEKCLVTVRSQICFRCIFLMQHVFTGIGTDPLLRRKVASSSSRRKSRLAPQPRSTGAHASATSRCAALCETTATAVAELCGWLQRMRTDIIPLLGPLPVGDGGVKGAGAGASLLDGVGLLLASLTIRLVQKLPRIGVRPNTVVLRDRSTAAILRVASSLAACALWVSCGTAAVTADATAAALALR